MDRVHYRRVTQVRRDLHEPGNSEEPTAFENIILQSVVSGILILIVLAISTFAPAYALRDNLRQVLSGAETPAELLAAMRFAGEEFFGYGPTDDDSQLWWEQPVYVSPTQVEEPAEIFIPYEVDEYQPPTAEGELLNPQIPGPSAVPELWN